MIHRPYTLKKDEDFPELNLAVLNKEGLYMEVPIKADESEEELQEQIDMTILSVALESFYESQIRDDMYCNTSIARQDYSLLTPEGQVILAELKKEFPDYDDYERSSFNIVGKYDGYREPYTNPSISFYNFDTMISEAMLLNFGTSYPTENLKNWYGLKFDLVTKEVLLKVVIKEYDGNKPDLPEGQAFYAITHKEDGTTGDLIDAYVYATPQRIRKFCEAKGLTYPLPPTEHKDCDVVWCWGFVFDKNTLEYGPVKGYARYNQATQALNLVEGEGE